MKKKLSQLTIFGGKPAFADALHVGCPNIPTGTARADFLQNIASILDRRWLTNHGPLVTEFENKIAKLIGARNVIAVCNATLGLQITAKACGLTGEIIVPAFTFVATAHALEWIGLEPVFADVEPQRHTIDVEQIERLITPRTSAIVATHLWGNACAIEQLAQIALRHQLQIIYDAAHAFGCSHQGQMLGSFGRAEVFSFHATKFLNSFEGGAITTNDDELARKIRRMMSFGFENIDHVVSSGTNAKMNEAAAAMGLANLQQMNEIIAINRRNYEAYEKQLQMLSDIRFVPIDANETRNYQYVILEIFDAALSRDQLLEVLWAEGIKARRYFYPGCHRMEPYVSQGRKDKVPVTERLSETVLALPTGTAVTLENINEVCAIIRLTVENASAVKRHLTRKHHVAVA